MGDQPFAEPVAQMGGLFTLDQISDHRHIIPLFKGDAGGGGSTLTLSISSCEILARFLSIATPLCL